MGSDCPECPRIKLPRKSNVRPNVDVFQYKMEKCLRDRLVGILLMSAVH